MKSKLIGLKDEKGFTLIELLVVMAILAVIAAIAVPRYLDFLAESKSKARENDIIMIKRAVELCLAAEKADNVETLLNTYGTATEIVEDEILVPKYLEEPPVDPVSGNVFKLQITQDGNIYKTEVTAE